MINNFKESIFSFRMNTMTKLATGKYNLIQKILISIAPLSLVAIFLILFKLTTIPFMELAIFISVVAWAYHIDRFFKDLTLNKDRGDALYV